jgi:hypothetical protein
MPGTRNDNLCSKHVSQNAVFFLLRNSLGGFQQEKKHLSIDLQEVAVFKKRDLSIADD